LLFLVLIIFMFLSRGCPVKPAAAGCLRCHGELEEKLKLGNAHPLFKDKVCLSCHNSHQGPQKQAGLKNPQKTLCVKCHRDQQADSERKKLHPPFGSIFEKKGKCTTCHDPHASEFQAILKKPQKKLCLVCHPSIAPFAAYDSQNLHPPFGVVLKKNGKCTVCHNPHGSDNASVLKLPQQFLCRMCHPSIAGLFEAPFQHKPFTEGKCTRCHNPHGSIYVRFLKSPEPTICFTCHDAGREDKAPDILSQVSNSASHHPLLESGKATGQMIVCTQCHQDIHGSLYVKLLGDSGNKFCYRCHLEKSEFFEGIGHGKDSRMPLPVSGTEIRCLACHESIHGSNFERLFVKHPVARCLECHETKNGPSDTLPKIGPKGHRHPMAFDEAGLKDPLNGREMSCYSTCHNPHGTGKEKLLQVPSPFSLENLDKFCRQCHLKAGIGF